MTGAAGPCIRIGALEVFPVIDGTASFSTRSAYRGQPQGFRGLDAADWELHADLLTADGRLEFTFGGYLVRGAGDRLLLVDLGVGPHADGPLPGGGMLDALAALGHSPAEVTDVVFTHLHFDHIGWASNNGAVTFPAARYRCERRDWDHFYGHDEQATAILAPIAERIDLWDGDAAIAPGVDVRLAAGHTPGSALVVLSSGAARALLLGDVVHCPVELLDDEWSGIADVDPALAQQTRNALARELEGTDVPVAGAHFPGLRFGRLLPGASRRTWRTA